MMFLLTDLTVILCRRNLNRESISGTDLLRRGVHQAEYGERLRCGSSDSIIKHSIVVFCVRCSLT